MWHKILQNQILLILAGLTLMVMCSSCGENPGLLSSAQQGLVNKITQAGSSGSVSDMSGSGVSDKNGSGQGGKGGDKSSTESSSSTCGICHIPPGNPGEKHEIDVPESAVQAHLDHGDYKGPCKSDS